MNHTHRTSRGFTLAEVLIALALLGIVAAFTIPKVMQNTGSNARNAVLKETIGSLYAVLNEGVLKNDITPTNFYSYFATRMNTIKACPTSANADGCWDTSKEGNVPLHFQFDEPAFVLPSGAIVAGFSPCCDSTNTGHGSSLPGEAQNTLTIDWNGLKPPNILGEDQLIVSVCFGNKPCRYNSTFLPVCTDLSAPSIYPQKVGSIMPSNYSGCGTATQRVVFEKSAALFAQLAQ